MGSRREVVFWVGACAVAAGGVVLFEQQRTRRERSEVGRKLDAGRAATQRGDHETAAKTLTEASAIMGRATSRAKAVVTLEAADANERVALETADPVRLSKAEEILEKSLTDVPGTDLEAQRARAVVLDRLASLAQTRGDLARAASLYRDAVGTFGDDLNGDKVSPRLTPVAFDLAGILHNFATCDYQQTGKHQRALTVLDQAAKFCDAVPDPGKRDTCSTNITDMRYYIQQAR